MKNSMTTTIKFLAVATRRNVDGKPDYKWTYTYTNGRPVIFDTEADALFKAKAACSDPCHALYNARTEEITH